MVILLGHFSRSGRALYILAVRLAQTVNFSQAANLINGLY